MEGLDRFQRENSYVPIMYMLGYLCVDEIHLLKGRDVSSIVECRFLLFLIYPPWKGDWDAVLRYVVKK